MANPRQRRKARSGKPKVVVSKRANTKLKKVTPRNFPGPLSNAYNPRQTPRQNYTRLGLLSGKLAPRLSGGIEKNVDLENIWLNKYKKVDEFELMNEDEEDAEEGEDTEDSEGTSGNQSELENRQDSNQSVKLSKGEGRIIRDANGKIIKVILGDESEIELEPTEEDSSKIIIRRNKQQSTSTPWGNPLDAPSYEQGPIKIAQAPPPSVLQGIGYSNPRQGTVPAKTEFVKELEKISEKRMNSYTETMRNNRHLSENQVRWLMKLIEKHGIDNTHSMARDLKLNRDQKTEGEIKHLISKLSAEF